MIGPALRLHQSDLARKARLLKELEASPAGAAGLSTQLARVDPRDFIRDILGAKPTPAALKHGYLTPWTPDQGKVLISVRDNRKTAVAAGVGVGKTRVAAWLALWFLYSRRPSKVITTAPTWLQVEKLLWKEIGAAFASSLVALPGKRLTTEIQLSEDHFALGLSTRTDVGDISATRFQGFHSANLMAILDEATGVPEEIWEGAEGLALSPDDRILAIGNPTDPGSRFKRVFDLGSWKTLNLDGRNHPNVLKNDHTIVPGAISKSWIDDKLEEYGSEDAPLFKAKVAGQFPDQAADALISIGWISRGQKRWRLLEELAERGELLDDGKGIALGLDVAGEGEDLTNLWAIDNSRLHLPMVNGKYAWHVGRDVMQAVALVSGFLREHVDQYGHTNVRCIAIDDTGIGQGCSARLMELQAKKKLPTFAYKDDREPRQVTIIRVNFSQSAFEKDRFSDIVDELWWGMREALRAEKLAIPTDDELAKYALPKRPPGRHSFLAQLMRPFYTSDSSGKIVVFDKRGRSGASDDRTRERVRQLPAWSPDLGHAAILARKAWSTLKVDTAEPRPRNTEEAFVKQMMELAAKKHRTREKKPNPYRGRNWSG